MTERAYRIIVADLPSSGDRCELLELVLAAASLDLTVQVVLAGRATELLSAPVDPGWQQLLDQKLAEVLIWRPQAWSGIVPQGARLLQCGSLADLPDVDVEIRA